MAEVDHVRRLIDEDQAQSHQTVKGPDGQAVGYPGVPACPYSSLLSPLRPVRCRSCGEKSGNERGDIVEIEKVKLTPRLQVAYDQG